MKYLIGFLWLECVALVVVVTVDPGRPTPLWYRIAAAVLGVLVASLTTAVLTAKAMR